MKTEKKRRLRRNTRRSLINYAIVIAAYAIVQALNAGGNIKSSLQGGDVDALLVDAHVEDVHNVLDNLPEGQGHNGQIVPPEPQHRHAHQQSEKAGEGGTHHHGDQ